MKGLNVLTENSGIGKWRLLMITAALAAGMSQFGTSALADGTNISRRDLLNKAVSLYEKLSGSEVVVPASLASGIDDSAMGKAVFLGFANADEIDSLDSSATLRKQDAMTVLYKTIIDFDDSFALSADEVNEIMNTCYDNALVDEENRVGYAFMLKHRIINGGADTEPNKQITKESCDVLIDVLYNIFMQDVSFTSNGTEIKFGSSIDTVVKAFGEPQRIDRSDSGFDWYVYNSDYKHFMMVGSDEGRVCAFYSNSAGASLDGVSVGDDILSTYKYAQDSSYRFFENTDEKVDAVMYNPFDKSSTSNEIDSRVRSLELIDIINSKRASMGLDALTVSENLWNTASVMPTQPKYTEIAKSETESHIADGAEHESGYDIFSIYAALVKADGDCFDAKTKSIGAATVMDDGYTLFASVVTGNASGDFATNETNRTGALATAAPNETPSPVPTEKPTPVPTEEPTPTPTAEPTQEPTVAPTESTIGGTSSAVFGTAVQTASDTSSQTASTAAPTEQPTATPTAAPTATPEPTAVPGSPVVVSPANGDTVNSGEDLTVELESSAASEYYVRIYSIEDDKYIVDSYIRTDDTKLTFDSSLFTAGCDYSIVIGAVTDSGTLDCKKFTITYGEVPDDAIVITSPEADVSTDNDHLELEWKCELFHDYIVDIYNEDGELILSQPVIDSHSLKLTDINPGKYYIYVNAMRRGTDNIIKVQASVNAEILQPEPVITEYVLEDGEKFYPIYENSELGLVYFYDEDIIEIDETDENGKTQTVKRKKITEKQIKATSRMKRFAEAQQTVEYFEGSDQLQIVKPTTVTVDENGQPLQVVGNGTVTGQAIVDEAAKYLGVPYVWGGTTPNGFDCSGLVQYVCRDLGIALTRVTQTQCMEGVEVSKDQLQPGDLIFFASNGDVHHVGIYAGNGMMIHAPHTGDVVRYQSIETPYYTSQFYCARRVTGLVGTATTGNVAMTPNVVSTDVYATSSSTATTSAATTSGSRNETYTDDTTETKAASGGGKPNGDSDGDSDDYTDSDVYEEIKAYYDYDASTVYDEPEYEGEEDDIAADAEDTDTELEYEVTETAAPSEETEVSESTADDGDDDITVTAEISDADYTVDATAAPDEGYTEARIEVVSETATETYENEEDNESID